MMLEELVERVCQAAGDPGRARYSQALVQEALRLALEEYSRVHPHIKEVDCGVQQAGRSQPLPQARDMLYLLRVHFPVSAESAPEVNSYCAFTRDGQPWIALGSEVPEAQPGQVMRVVYGGLHTLEGLDGAQVSTLPPVDAGLIVQGAAGHAMYMRADSLVEAYGKRTPQDDTFAAARRRLEDFRARLRRRRSPDQPVAPWAERSGWRLDGMDAG